MPRHEFSQETKTLLAQRVGYRCSNPACGVATVGPSDTPTNKEYIGVAAHVYSASIDNGPRAKSDLTEQERRSPDNGIHLCRKCATIIDYNNGADYPPEVLFNWKRYAEAAAKERIYRTRPLNLFSRIDFSNLEQQYSTALTCTGLTEKNILSCPSDHNLVRDTINKLQLASKCILLGSSGSGKSLITYQVAHTYHVDKWNVFKINKQSISNSTIFAAPAAKSVIVIDDAQTIETHYLENLLGSAYKDCIVLANWNISTLSEDAITKRFPIVEIVPSSQVQMLKEFCIGNSHEIAETLRSIGLKVQKNDPHRCIDSRIARAARERTPWLFNYSLTEGWHAAKNDFDLLKHDQGLHVVLATVAAFQFATLDMGICQDVVIDALRNYNNDTGWLQRAKAVMRQRCLVQDDKIRNKHYEYSRKILNAFVAQEDAKEDHNYLTTLLKEILTSEEYERGHSTIIEFVMFDYRQCAHTLKSEGFTQDLAEQLAYDDRVFVPAKVRKLNSLIRISPNTMSALRLRENFVENLVLCCSKDNAYQLADFLNTLNNEKYGPLDLGVPICDHLITLITSSDIEDQPRYSRVMNRLCYLLSTEDRRYASEKLGESALSLSLPRLRATMACYHFSSVVNDLSEINPAWADEQVATNATNIASMYNTDFANALDYFSALLCHYFQIVGFVLGIYRPRSTLKKRGRELARQLNESAIVNGFQSVSASQLQTYSDVLMFLAIHNRSKLALISDKFDYARLESLTSTLPEIDHYHRNLVSLLHNPASANWRRHASYVVCSVNYVEHVFFVWDEDLAAQRLRDGIKYRMDIHMCEDCETELSVLKHLHKSEEQTLFRRVIHENVGVLKKAVRNSAQNSDDHRSKFDLLVFLFSNCESVLKEIFSDEQTCIAVTDKFERLLRGKKWEKLIGRLYVISIKKHSVKCTDKLLGIERRFPSARNLNLADLVQCVGRH